MVKNKSITRFDEYFNCSLNESNKIKKAAGICITYQNKILLVHSTDSNHERNAVGIPKGGINDGEKTIYAALRDLREETGIRINKRSLNQEVNVANSYNKDGNINWQLYYYTIDIKDLSRIGMESESIDPSNLQTTEIDWAKFISYEEAYSIINRSQLIIIDRLKNK